MNRLVALILILGVVILAGATIWLLQAPTMPPVHKTELSIPDDHIPR